MRRMRNLMAAAFVRSLAASVAEQLLQRPAAQLGPIDEMQFLAKLPRNRSEARRSLATNGKLVRTAGDGSSSAVDRAHRAIARDEVRQIQRRAADRHAW